MTVIVEDIRRIWSQILGQENVADDANFFELGGDSIAALNMLFETGNVVGADLSPVLLFEYPVFADFARAAREPQAQENA